MNELVIFDMDGLLVDSEPLQLRSYIEVFKKHNIEITPEEYIREWIHNGKSVHHYVDIYGMATDENKAEVIQTIRDEKKEIYDQLIEEELEIKESVEKLLRDLHGKIPMVIASSSRMESLEKITKKFGIDKYFIKIFSDALTGRAKPFPDMFLKAADEMNVNASACVVIEDAVKGLKAAKAAGMKCIICPDELTKNGDFSEADLIVKSLRELDYEIIKKL